MSLTNEIADFEAEKKRTHDPDILDLMDATTADLIATGIAERAVGIGDQAPDFELPDHRGNPVALARLLETGPVILNFYRGGWCPYCNLELRAYQRELPRIRAGGGHLLAISPMLPDNSLSAAEKNEIDYPVLSDVGNETTGDFGLVFEVDKRIQKIYTERLGIDMVDNYGDDSFQLPLPALYVIGKDGIVKFAYVNADYRLRADPVDVLRALDSTG